MEISAASLKFSFLLGNWVIEAKFEYADSFSEGLAVAKVEDKYGFIDKPGEFVIQPIYENALSFSEGFAPVKVPQILILDENPRRGSPNKSRGHIVVTEISFSV